jgi:hypothetical protein
MKKFLIVVFVFVLFGCAENQQRFRSYVDDPGTFLKDPHYAEYQENLNDLESSYLSKEISYSEYLKQKSQLDNDYERDVQRRTKTIYGEE